MLTSEMAAAQAATGAALLDQRKPGWAAAIDLGTLSMGSCWNCISAQLFGSFGMGMVELFGWDMTHHDRWYIVASDHGFYARSGSGQDYAHLAAAWRDEIERRQWATEVYASNPAVAYACQGV